MKKKKNGARRRPNIQSSNGPIEKAPAPPAGFEAPVVGRGKGTRVWTMLGALAENVASELRDSETFASDFGEKQSPEDLAELLRTASRWRKEKSRARSWLAYTSDGDRTAWRAVLKGLDRFQKAFEYAIACDPTVAARYPHTAQMLRAKSASSSRAAATRAKKKSAPQVTTPTPTSTP
jgi:hypothetical protein